MTVSSGRLSYVDDNSVSTIKIQDSAVTAAKLATDAVETLKIKDLNVTTGKIADGAVTPAKLSVSSLAIVMYSTAFDTSIVGNGAAQNIASKSFLAGDWAVGDLMRVVCSIRLNATAGGGNVYTRLTLASTNFIAPQVNAAPTANVCFEWLGSPNSSDAEKSLNKTRIIVADGSGTDNETVAYGTSNADIFGNAFDFKLTVDPAVSTTLRCRGLVFVEKIAGGAGP